ncbi:uncharacterized protein LOC122512674 isoform X3 [Leptopilina heterotoma]|uniref:uncharacterized protein LOC122512674 isoform X3 n=1 Tax=Leptopilina heterotoma TaxID=63436 RepID=UPI001CA8CF2C|nr:uncharacterized protein LOC122512674 isoform X3 [Leptopilina heterotoma]XP_043484594.1 uncharacterized protein LOC122512674 isoform X3 [Leptopilina heterotoma]XP_043484595.1 uncharacterized protein LOC122512674 isoform X3 [Leptopilina heterotoma]
MESTTFISPLTNNQVFSVCHYISTLGIILNINNLLSTPVENDTVPVLNAFFEYLNKSNNESAAKIQLFKEIRSKINDSGYKELNNFTNVNKFYRYIINVGLFAHYRNITGYVRTIFQNNNNKSFSNLQEILFHDFSNNPTNKNICSLRKESKNLNYLAIKRIFKEYVLPVFTEMWKEKKNLNVQRDGLKIVKRFRRQESSSEDSDSGALVIDEDSSEEEDPLRKFRLEFLSKLRIEGLRILDQERDLFHTIVNIIALEQVRDGFNYPLELWLLDFTTNVSSVNFLISLKGATFSFYNFELVTRNPSGKVPPSIRNPHSHPDETNILYHITSESLNGFVDLNQYNIHNLYILFPHVNFTVTDTRYEVIENRFFLIVDLERQDLSTISWFNIIKTTKNRELSNTRNSSRMNAIKRAAEFISSNVPMKTFAEAVNMLKNYLLSVYTYNPNFPTYQQLSENYSNDTTILDVYSPWKIDNKYVNDVLYESKFYFHYNKNEYYWTLSEKRSAHYKSNFDYYYDKYSTDLNYFQNKLRFEDFFKIGYKLFSLGVRRVVKDVKVALLRVALRQCDEELNEEPIVLYQAFYVTDTRQNIKLYTREHVTFKISVPCSRNRNLLLSNFLNNTTGTGILFFFEIKLKNRCGVADIYQLYKNEVMSHFLLTNEIYQQTDKFEDIINNQRVIFMTVESDETISKEEKMINIVNDLNTFYMKGYKNYIHEY